MGRGLSDLQKTILLTARAGHLRAGRVVPPPVVVVTVGGRGPEFRRLCRRLKIPGRLVRHDTAAGLLAGRFYRNLSEVRFDEGQEGCASGVADRIQREGFEVRLFAEGVGNGRDARSRTARARYYPPDLAGRPAARAAVARALNRLEARRLVYVNYSGDVLLTSTGLTAAEELYRLTTATRGGS
jgi:hypothetical protein